MKVTTETNGLIVSDKPNKNFTKSVRDLKNCWFVKLSISGKIYSIVVITANVIISDHFPENL